MIDPNLNSLKIQPRCLPADSAWIGHIPFVCALVETLNPKTFVELGTHSGSSYFAVCQTIQALKRSAESKCWAVDTWQGDAHAQYEGTPIYEAVQKHNSEHYRDFSTLLRGTFDEALKQFEKGSVDLLHIDGYHTYEAVKHDFETWRDKLSSQSVVLFHDTNEYSKDFGVWKFWDEISQEFPHFHFRHEHGLGVLLTGEKLPKSIVELASQESQLQRFFYPLAEELKNKTPVAPPPELDLLQVELGLAREKIAELRTKSEKSREQKNEKAQTLKSYKQELRDLRWFAENKNSLFLKLAKPFARFERSLKKRLGK